LSFWRADRHDCRAMVAVALIPIALALPQLTPWLKADPLYYTANMAIDKGSVTQRGVPYVDPNNGFQTQALGFRAAKDWISGEVPWWNPYTGVGMPLAAEYQPSAFFPPTLLLLLPRGTVFLQAALQVLSGLGAYALLRQLRVMHLAAFAGAAVFAVNGTLAWFAHGPAAALPFLPWFLFGIERAFVAARERWAGGWRTIAAAMGLSLLAGFPETAYIDGLLALSWAAVRGIQLPDFHARSRYGARIAAGGLTALAIASPQVLAFALYLPHAHVGHHHGAFAGVHYGPQQAIATLVAPYAFGPPMGYGPRWEAIYHIWGGLGGYVTLAVIAMGAYGFSVRREPVAWLLLAWLVTTLGKSFGIPPFMALWNLVPGVPEAAFNRYVQPTWELAFAVLAAFAIDHALREPPRRGALATAAVVAAAAWLGCAWVMSGVWTEVTAAGSLRTWALASFGWAAACTAMALFCLARRRMRAAVALIAMDAALMCAIPMLSNPHQGRIDVEAVDFLRANLGLHRFYTFEPIQPNYGAYFGIASINHNYLPVPESWVQHVRTHLDRKWTDYTVFNGDPTRNSPQEFRANLRAFENVGVKYVVSHAHWPHAEGLPGVRRVYEDAIIWIYELPAPKPYFESLDAACRLDASERRSVRADCPRATTLLRRELFFPGWTASVNGAEARIEPRDRIFQSVALPAGVSEVRFSYAPPGIGWAWAAMWLGLAALAAPSLLLRRNHQ
jgi:hypothetical protein